MENLLSFLLLSRILGHPLTALLIVVIIYLVVNRSLSGWLPDFTRSWRRAAQIRQLRSTVALNPADARSLMELGAMLLSARKPREALPYLEQAAAKMDDHAHALYYLGAAYAETGQFAKAVPILDKAIALRPEVEHGSPYVYLAQITLGRPGLGENADDEQVAAWVAAVIRYGDAETCYRLGSVLLQAGKKAEAQQLFLEALDHYQRSPGFVRRAARIWALRSRLSLKRLGVTPNDVRHSDEEDEQKKEPHTKR